jgi:hypothetical protein
VSIIYVNMPNKNKWFVISITTGPVLPRGQYYHRASITGEPVLPLASITLDMFFHIASIITGQYHHGASITTGPVLPQGQYYRGASITTGQYYLGHVFPQSQYYHGASITTGQCYRRANITTGPIYQGKAT